MKLLSIVLLILGSNAACAFSTPSHSTITKHQVTTLSMSSNDESWSDDERSSSVPFAKKNPLLDGSFPGDAQFDPLFLAENEELLFNYREAEIKV